MCLPLCSAPTEIQAYPVQAAVVDKVGLLESLMVPADYSKKLEANIPSEFADLPRVLGRAKVRKPLYCIFVLCGYACFF